MDSDQAVSCQKGAILNYMYSVVRMVIAHDAAVSGEIWQLRRQQDQAYNLGVEVGLASDRPVGAFDAYKRLTELRAGGHVPKRLVRLQRAGMRRGAAAVAAHRRAVFAAEQSVAYWTEAVAKDQNDVERLEYAERRLARAERRLTHLVERGEKRLFRSRKTIERANGPALVFDEGCRIDGTTLVLSGRLRVRLAQHPGLESGWAFTGAAQIVDATRKVTRRTRPEQRKYRVHLSIKGPDPHTVEPRRRSDITGVDVGVAIAAATSDGNMHRMPDETSVTAMVEKLSRHRARLTRGSRKWKELTRRIRRLCRKRTNRRVNGSRQIAARIATQAVAEVAVEDLKPRSMGASARGTMLHPGRNVAAKRGLNRSLSRAAIGRLHDHIERACQTRGKSYTRVPAQHSSLICHLCGTVGRRETQTEFNCPTCGWNGHADFNAAVNVQARAWERRQGACRRETVRTRGTRPPQKAVTNESAG